MCFDPKSYELFKSDRREYFSQWEGAIATKFRSLAWKMCLRQECEDVAQQAMLNMWRAPGPDRPSSFRRWAMTIATNCALNAIKRKRRFPGPLLADEGNEPVVKATQVDHPEKGEVLAQLQKCMEGLSPELRIVVVLRCEDYKWKEIAAKLERALGTVHPRLDAAHRALKKCMEGRWHQ